MKLHKKTFTAICLVTMALLLAGYYISQSILLSSYARLEKQDTEQKMGRILGVLSDDVSGLDAIASDWAAWDDTYAFVQDGNEEYTQSNVVYNSFSNNRVNLMLFVNFSGEVVFGKAYDLQTEEETNIPEKFFEQSTESDLIMKHYDATEVVSGIVMLPEGPMIISSQPILTSEKKGPIQGALVWGRYLDSNEVKRLSDIINMPIEAYQVNDSMMPYDVQIASQQLTGNKTILSSPLDEDNVAGYAIIDDIYRRPSLILKTYAPRSIYKQGLTSMRYLILLLLGASIVFAIAIITLVERLVLSRLSKLSRDVVEIGASGDLSKHVSVGGDDELSDLASEINKMLEERKKVEKMKEEFYATVTHELKTPVTSVISFADSLYNDKAGKITEKQKEILGYVIQDAFRLRHIIDRILMFSKLEMGLAMHTQEVDFEAILDNALRVFTPSASEKNIRLGKKISSKLPKVWCDADRITDVLNNLIGNAVKFTKEGGSISVEAVCQNNEILVKVSDTGIGIPSEDLGKISEKFYQVDPSKTNVVGGSGLGLYVSKKIVEKHGGRFWVESVFGRGSTFYFTMPLSI
ncbi:MAG: HAMP domain-containing protein [Candidatus Altiarchaeales archaeon]|nr:HAMP domain-containing protein [Candidatus Altiarchaeales archaeon]